MAREADNKIEEVLSQFGIPFAGNVWRVQGTPVIYHETLERIARQLGVLWDPPTVLRAERDECVILVTGMIKHGKEVRAEWSIGEALVNVNYRVSGKQAAYVFAMAEKRAKDRVILKLIDLSGLVYSQEEADEFRQGAPAIARGRDDAADTPDEIETRLRAEIDAAETVETVTELMLSEATVSDLAYLAPGIKDDVRQYAKDRLWALGWRPPESKGPPVESQGEAPAEEPRRTGGKASTTRGKGIQR